MYCSKNKISSPRFFVFYASSILWTWLWQILSLVCWMKLRVWSQIKWGQRKRPAFLFCPQKNTGNTSWTLTVSSKDDEQGRKEMSPTGGCKGGKQTWPSGVFWFTHTILNTFCNLLPTFKAGWFHIKIHTSSWTWEWDALQCRAHTPTGHQQAGWEKWPPPLEGPTTSSQSPPLSFLSGSPSLAHSHYFSGIKHLHFEKQLPYWELPYGKAHWQGSEGGHWPTASKGLRPWEKLNREGQLTMLVKAFLTKFTGVAL